MLDSRNESTVSDDQERMSRLDEGAVRVIPLSSPSTLKLVV